ncbi:MAG TPA: hypothetical protein ENL03_02850, partial [Phycisphaerae bacterium]|nr:hypothetical protein [Phycisphaerae bacterium]
WVTHERGWATGRKSDIATRFQVMMRGLLGVGDDIDRLSDSDFEEYRKYIQFYKEIRDVIQFGDVYLLEKLSEKNASAIQYLSEDASEAVFSLVSQKFNFGLVYQPVTLKGLVPDAVYEIRDPDQSYESMTGLALMTIGVPPAGKWQGCRTLYLKRT